MIILRQREFGNKANKAAKKALEQRRVDSAVNKLGNIEELDKQYPGWDWKKIQSKAFKNIGRNKNLINTVGGKLGTFNGDNIHYPETFNAPKELTLDRKINLKGFMDKLGKLGDGKERAKNVKKIIKNEPVMVAKTGLGNNNSRIWNILR